MMDDDKLVLIELIRSRSHIWDNKDPLYKDKLKRKAAFLEIASALSKNGRKFSDEDVARMWKNLKDTALRIRKRKPAVDDAEIPTDWPYWTEINFIFDSADQADLYDVRVAGGWRPDDHLSDRGVEQDSPMSAQNHWRRGPVGSPSLLSENGQTINAQVSTRHVIAEPNSRLMFDADRRPVTFNPGVRIVQDSYANNGRELPNVGIKKLAPVGGEPPKKKGRATSDLERPFVEAVTEESMVFGNMIACVHRRLKKHAPAYAKKFKHEAMNLMMEYEKRHL